MGPWKDGPAPGWGPGPTPDEAEGLFGAPGKGEVRLTGYPGLPDGGLDGPGGPLDWENGLGYLIVDGEKGDRGPPVSGC